MMIRIKMHSLDVGKSNISAAILDVKKSNVNA